MGLIWAVVLVASGMIFNAGMTAVVGLHGTDPAQAVAVWQAIEPVAQGLGGSGGELLDGLWVLLVSVAALRTGGLSKVLNWRFASTGVLLVKAPLLSLVVPQRIRVCSEHPGQSDLLVLKELMESGKLTPVVGRTYPLSRTREAISSFGEGHAEGKVVITI